MCVVCGCNTGTPAATASTEAHDPVHEQDHGHVHTHTAHAHHDAAATDLHYGQGSAGVSVPGMSQARAIRLEADVLGHNNRIARRNRAHFFAHGVTALNLVSSPGSGKTTLLCATIRALRAQLPDLPLAVIEGDQQTSMDADRIRETGAAAIQVNTGKGCHLDAQMVADAFERLPLHGSAFLVHHGHHTHHAHDEPHPHEHSHQHHHEHPHEHPHEHHHPHAEKLLFIENVGNLVCPAMWDLGEAAKVAILSVTEGEDKPLKYPDMFVAARLMILNKIDLLPHLQFDVARCIAYARRVNPGIEVLQVSATTGEGMQAWLSWLMHVEPAL